VLWFPGLLAVLLLVLGLGGRGMLGTGFVLTAPLLAVAGWSGYAQVPRYLRPHVRRLARRHPLVGVAAVLWLVAAVAAAVWAVAVWPGARPRGGVLGRGPVLVPGLPPRGRGAREPTPGTAVAPPPRRAAAGDLAGSAGPGGCLPQATAGPCC